MSKRFTETTKWDKKWFFDLSSEMKLVWLYLCDRCNHAGIWDVNFSLMEFHLGFSVSKDDLNNAMSDRLFWINDTKLYLTTFVEFQNKLPLKESNNAHASILALLSSYQIKLVPEGLPRGCPGAQVEVEVKVKEEVKVKVKEEAGNATHNKMTAKDIRLAVAKIGKKI